MENLVDFEGDSMEYGEVTASTDLREELVTSLASFLRIYSQRSDHLQRASENFTLVAAPLLVDDSEKVKIASWLSAVGKCVGIACGGLTGGVGGILGGVGAATYIHGVGPIMSFVGSVLGGVVGGAVSGAVGGLVCASAKATGRPIHGVVGAVSDVAWLTIGGVTGFVVGGIFGRKVGAAGGAVGGFFGAFCATRCAVDSVGFIVAKSYKSNYSKNLMMRQESGDFCETIKPLVDELETIQTISDKMASSAVVHGVAGQTAKTLTSVTSMLKLIIDSQSPSDLPQFDSGIEEAVKQSKKITEEMEEMRAEVEQLLVSLRE